MITTDSKTTEVMIPELVFQAGDGARYAVRRVTTADVEVLTEFVFRLSDKTRSLRFMLARPFSRERSLAEARRMVRGAAGGDFITLMAKETGTDAVVAVAELVCDPARDSGEVALVVLDNVQRKGIGRMLLRQLLQIAQAAGLADVHGDMLAENHGVRRLTQALHLPFSATIEAGVMHIIVSVRQ